MFDLSSTSSYFMRVPLSLGGVLGDNVPLREVIFAWTAALGKILTMNNLRKQSVIGVVCVKRVR